uniref:DNA-directed RNA polymerase III subunit RPC9 n=1 Tax=Trichobilharzia regenti TaxID=157069 RepID=A0AA85KK26_TRIRE|nr:unnamed protein product [Trichobilharzia regenti]
MELIDSQNPRLLTNIEVLKLIKESKKKVRRQQTLLYTCGKYLNSKTPSSKQSESEVQAFAEAIKPFNLTKAEILMLINHCPSSQVELSVLISDLDSRLSNSQADEILQLVEKHFPEGVAASQTINSTGTFEEVTEETA